MTQLLESVLEKIAALPEEKQNSFASYMLAELEADARWDSLFAASPGMLVKMADEALQEFEAGETEILDP